MTESRRSGHRSLRATLITAYAVTFALVIGLFGFWTDRLMVGRVAPGQMGSVRLVLVAGAILIGLVGLVVVSLIAHHLARPLSQITMSAEELASGELQTSAPRSSIGELDRLAAAVNHVASELGRRMMLSEEERSTLEQVLATVVQGIILVEEDDGIGYANPSSYAMLGRVPDHLSGLVPYGLQRLVREARAGRQVSEADFEHGAPVRLLRSAATPFPHDGRVLLVMADVTDRTRLEAVRRDFVAAASHELKTPVSAILASAETLQMALGRDPEAAERFTAQIEKSARQLARLVSDLLDLSRLESEQPERDQIRVDRVVGDELERVEAIARGAGVELKMDLSSATVHGNARDLSLAARNLLDNALRHTPRGGQVVVTVSASNAVVEVGVADTGVGIPTRELSRIFERFYRVDAARDRATGGTGLGLAIVKHVVESMGGKVTVESEFGSGSTFRLLLPAAETVPVWPDRPQNASTLG